MTFTIPCLFGLEGLVADEVRRLGLGDVRPETGRVLCTGTEADIPRLNIGLRCGERVLIELAAGPARSFEALFQLASAVPWEDLIPQNGRFPVKGHALDSQLHSVPDCQKTVKKAAADRLGRAYGLERLPEDGPLYQLQFSLLRDQCALYLDTTGPGLHKRGYRAVGVEAPLRETLAAAMVILSRFRGKDPFRDPFCGSGTIVIEAALIAKNRAPGLDRSFDARSGPLSPPGTGWTPPGRPWTGSSTAITTSGAGTSTPRPSASPGRTPGRPGWRTWSASTQPTPARSAVRGTTDRWSPIPPTASGFWSRRRPGRSTAGSAMRGGSSRPNGAPSSSPATRSSSGASDERPASAASSITG